MMPGNTLRLKVCCYLAGIKILRFERKQAYGNIVFGDLDQIRNYLRLDQRFPNAEVADVE
jgi:hypothetical protein